MMTSKQNNIQKIPSRSYPSAGWSDSNNSHNPFSRRRHSRRAKHGHSGLVGNLLALHALSPGGIELSSGREGSNSDALQQWVHRQLQFPDSSLSEQLLDILLPRFEQYLLQTDHEGGVQ
jgi:hypothetical protein